ncbi:MAG: hypothetical protein DLM72_01640 [Candidatus Nitrosopolaris wilkensis]|nr:MAG: hypothetical protein DLM72_01640 [Candidatus Nitrosopolaris wilkensis]
MDVTVTNADELAVDINASKESAVKSSPTSPCSTHRFRTSRDKITRNILIKTMTTTLQQSALQKDKQEDSVHLIVKIFS